MRRFYNAVSVVPDEADFTVNLDGKPVNTPGKKPLLLATARLAEAVAEEWRAQDAFIVPATMKLTQIANTAIDRVGPNRAAIVDGTAEYSGSDLVCYRAETPPELVAEQSDLFDPLLDWFEERTGQSMIVARGLMPLPQSPGTLQAVRELLAAKTDAELTVIHLTAGLAASFVIALALAEGRLDAAQAFQAANIEELFQIRQWGEDDEARARLDAAQQEFEVLERFVELVKH